MLCPEEINVAQNVSIIAVPGSIALSVGSYHGLRAIHDGRTKE
jgi:hypothetical protein